MKGHRITKVPELLTREGDEFRNSRGVGAEAAVPLQLGLGLHTVHGAAVRGDDLMSTLREPQTFLTLIRLCFFS